MASRFAFPKSGGVKRLIRWVRRRVLGNGGGNAPDFGFRQWRGATAQVLFQQRYLGRATVPHRPCQAGQVVVALLEDNRRQFLGQQALFPAVAEGFDQLLALVEKLVDIYNESLAEDIERLEKLLAETGRQEESTLAIDLAGLENVREAAGDQIAYMVDMAKSDALDVLGETRQAFELVDRHV